MSVDVENMQFFHDKAFPGIDSEKHKLWGIVSELERILDPLNDGDIALHHIPLASGDLDKICAKYPKCAGDLRDLRFQGAQGGDAASAISIIKTNGYVTLPPDEVWVTRLWKSDRVPTDTYRALCRLTAIGLVSDYTIDYHRGSVEANLCKKRAGDYTNGLITYVGRFLSREQAASIRGAIDNQPGKTEALKCLGFIVQFVYDRIEAKRQQAIREMESAILDGIAGKNFETIINTYFDSKYIPLLRPHLRSNRFEVVLEFMDEAKVDIDSLNHLRGACDRLLVDEPDDGCLLTLRGYARILIPQYDKHDAIRDIEMGLDILDRENSWGRPVRAEKLNAIVSRCMTLDQTTGVFLSEMVRGWHATWLNEMNRSIQNG